MIPSHNTQIKVFGGGGALKPDHKTDSLEQYANRVAFQRGKLDAQLKAHKHTRKVHARKEKKSFTDHKRFSERVERHEQKRDEALIKVVQAQNDHKAAVLAKDEATSKIENLHAHIKEVTREVQELERGQRHALRSFEKRKTKNTPPETKTGKKSPGRKNKPSLKRKRAKSKAIPDDLDDDDSGWVKPPGNYRRRKTSKSPESRPKTTDDLSTDDLPTVDADDNIYGLGYRYLPRAGDSVHS